ncbi:acyltransferase family protein [Neobacillus drentensis]|uniref:acyltransferase family protein n=1 Tax=Neobacillus drentensis TaxID=220684 RepID=UPI003000851C
MENRSFVFSRNMTAISKGFAILLMVYHHSFAFPNRISDVDYKPIMIVNALPLDQLIADFGKLCVAIFLFLSRFGLYKSFEAKGSSTFKQGIKRIINFFKLYWIIFFIFIPIGLIFFNDTIRYTWNTKQFFYNLFPLIHTYNGDWWFIPVYIEFLFVFPLLIRLVEKNPVFVCYLSFTGLFLSGFFLHIDDIFSKYELIQILINHLGTDLIWQVMFVIGIFFAKYSLFGSMDKFFLRAHLNFRIIFLSLLVLCYYIRQYALKYVIDIRGTEIEGIYDYADFLLTPIAIFSFVKLIQNITILERLFLILGKHSTIIWLTHTFFIYYYFQDIMFAPYYSVFIVIWVFVITILVSIGINLFINLLHFPFSKNKAE